MAGQFCRSIVGSHDLSLLMGFYKHTGPRCRLLRHHYGIRTDNPWFVRLAANVFAPVFAVETHSVLALSPIWKRKRLLISAFALVGVRLLSEAALYRARPHVASLVDRARFGTLCRVQKRFCSMLCSPPTRANGYSKNQEFFVLLPGESSSIVRVVSRSGRDWKDDAALEKLRELPDCAAQQVCCDAASG
jgi:hypothetical protein